MNAGLIVGQVKSTSTIFLKQNIRYLVGQVKRSIQVRLQVSPFDRFTMTRSRSMSLPPHCLQINEGFKMALNTNIPSRMSRL
jgi:hypothetical protein